jgi:hypothetical protein
MIELAFLEGGKKVREKHPEISVSPCLIICKSPLCDVGHPAPYAQVRWLIPAGLFLYRCGLSSTRSTLPLRVRPPPECAGTEAQMATNPQQAEFCVGGGGH